MTSRSAALEARLNSPRAPHETDGALEEGKPRSNTLKPVTPERCSVLTKAWSKHVHIENIGAQATIEVVEHDSDGVVTAVVRIEPGDAAQFTPTSRHALSVVLLDD